MPEAGSYILCGGGAPFELIKINAPDNETQGAMMDAATKSELLPCIATSLAQFDGACGRPQVMRGKQK